MGTKLTQWTPEDSSFWNSGGSKVAWTTLVVTTLSLIFSFATWFTMSAIVVRLPQVGFQFDTMQLFWLAAMPGLAGGTFRVIHTFLIPIFGTRNVISVASLIKIIPCVGIAWGITHPETPYWFFLTFALLLGFGGGDFSSFMPSTSLFFPKRLQGTALGIQAGIGNFGVSLAQFVTPWILGFAVFGALSGPSQSLVKGEVRKEVWLQNSVTWYIPVLLVVTILAWMMLKRVPVKASFSEQLDIFKNKHTWFCTITYVMTFGSFSGLSAAFPLMIKTLYGKFDGAPDPLTYAFLGPLIGSLIRVVMGWPSDKWGGSIFTQLSGIGLALGSIALIFGGYLAPTSLDQFPGFVGVMLFLFFFSGVGNASTFRQYPIIFAESPRQAAGVIGWTAAVAAYGPFVFSSLIGISTTALGSPIAFFVGAIGFYLIGTGINWWYYTRKGAERGDWGTGRTWWDFKKAA